MIGMKVSRHLVYPRPKTVFITRKRVAVFDDPVKEVLGQVLADFPVKGQFHKEIVQFNMVTLEKLLQVGQGPFFHLHHDHFVGMILHTL